MDARKAVTRSLGITSNVIVSRAGLVGYDWIAEAGFDCVDFNMQRGFYRPEELAYADDFFETVQKHRESLRRCGLRVSQTHGPYYVSDGSLRDPDDLERYFRAVEQALQATKLLQCRRFVIHPLYTLPWMQDSTDWTNRSLTRALLERLTVLAAGTGIWICLENLPYDFCNDLDSHRDYLSLGDPAVVKGCFDTGHAILHEAEPGVHLREMRSQIRAVHLHDNDGRRDLHQRIDPEKACWGPIFAELLQNPDVETLSLETSGIYKRCAVQDMPAELKRDHGSLLQQLDRTAISEAGV